MKLVNNYKAKSLYEYTFFERRTSINMIVIKRNGQEVEYDQSKIVKAVQGAVHDVYPAKNDKFGEDIGKGIADEVTSKVAQFSHAAHVEEIQDLVEDILMDAGRHAVAKAYIKYRYEHELARKGTQLSDKVKSIVDSTNEEVIQENANKNPHINSTQRDYIAGEVSKQITFGELLPKDIVDAHNEGVIHFHDSDYYIQRSFNCCLLNLDDMLQNGTMISGTLIERPHSFSTACNIATQIIAQVASNQYGGQSISLAALAPFVDVSRQKIRKQVEEEYSKIIRGQMCGDDISAEEKERTISEIVEERVKEEVTKGIQTIQYQVITLMTTNGQAPFITLWMYIDEVPEGQTRDDLVLIIEETIKQRYQGIKNENGAYITTAFPKLIYCLDEDNITEDSKYWYLTELAAKCSAKRLVPDYVSAKMMRKLKLSKGEVGGKGDIYPPMGCRSFLTPDRSGNGWSNISNAKNYEEDTPKYFGRFNQGVVTINLVDVALSAKAEWTTSAESGSMDALYSIFWGILEKRLELCHRALRNRHERLLGTLSDSSPIHWQYGGLARLKKGETIDKLLYGGYSTISLGYAGLYECVKAITGRSHTDDETKPFALEIMKKLNDKCAEWKTAEDIDYSVYGTPIESTTYKFSKCLQKRFGVIPGITDKNYITNSYHVHVTEEIDPFTKLKFESEFQALSPGGAISYIESSDLTGNIDAMLDVIQFIYDNIMYAEINCKSDYCQVCGYDGEIQIVENKHNKLIWKCPNCGNTDRNKMNVARRVCGYISTNDMNQGRTQEIKERYIHLGGE